MPPFCETRVFKATPVVVCPLPLRSGPGEHLAPALLLCRSLRSTVSDLETRVQGLQRTEKDVEDLKRKLRSTQEELAARSKKADLMASQAEYLRKALDVAEGSVEALEARNK